MGDNLAGLVRAAARARPGGPALMFRTERITWAELDARVDRAAAALLALGLQPGDRVALQLGNTPQFAVGYFGTLRAGLVSVPLNTGYTGRELQHVLADSGARALITSDTGAALATAAKENLPDLEHVIMAEGGRPGDALPHFDDLLAAVPGTSVREVGGGEDLAVLIYTSGTSGAPKGAMLSHRALLANLEQVSSIEPPVLGRDDVLLLVLPLFHVYGLNPGLGMLAYHGATGLLVERFNPHDTLALIARHEVTSVLGAPPMYIAWSMLPGVADGFQSVRLALSGSAPLPPDTLRRFAESAGLTVFEGYGLTETAPVLTSTLMSDVPKPDSIGRPIPGIDIKLVDEQGDEVDEDDHGEIVVRGANLFSGYWPDGEGGPDADGWWPTGDIAFADQDADLHLVDRRTELILVSGFNVYPREVEIVLLAHPDVTEVAVIAVPDPLTGEAVKAVVVPRPGSALTQESVITHCEKSLARFKCPSVVEFVADLPHTIIGKVRKGQLRTAGSAS
ncbi:MAG: AMP-binding protein [Actinomycetota bacterium]|nr:AMP-binding protein [Actinomycetota bacterium]